jgi:hypothetical protein
MLTSFLLMLRMLLGNRLLVHGLDSLVGANRGVYALLELLDEAIHARVDAIGLTSGIAVLGRCFLDRRTSYLCLGLLLASALRLTRDHCLEVCDDVRSHCVGVFWVEYEVEVDVTRDARGMNRNTQRW